MQRLDPCMNWGNKFLSSTNMHVFTLILLFLFTRHSRPKFGMLLGNTAKFKNISVAAYKYFLTVNNQSGSTFVYSNLIVGTLDEF